jgi:hypothetical protein
VKSSIPHGDYPHRPPGRLVVPKTSTVLVKGLPPRLKKDVEGLKGELQVALLAYPDCAKYIIIIIIIIDSYSVVAACRSYTRMTRSWQMADAAPLY